MQSWGVHGGIRLFFLSFDEGTGFYLYSDLLLGMLVGRVLPFVKGMLLTLPLFGHLNSLEPEDLVLEILMGFGGC